MSEPLVGVSGVVKDFTVRERGRKRTVRAVDDVSLDIHRGETLALVGESGSGKSTLGRLILQLESPTSGSIRFDGEELVGAGRAGRRTAQRSMQVIFQDPYSSLNPVRSALLQVAEPVSVLSPEKDAEAVATAALAQVGITGDAVHRLPRSFSGGQRQRIAIARAIAVAPALIVADEPVSALDVQVQAQVTDLLRDLQRELGLTYLFISHDLAVVREIATRVAVMYRGQVVEEGPTAEIFDHPQHPYTRKLLDAVLVADPAIARARLRQISDAATGI
ncbi:ATP-binding cassette domain-containing protein [Microbacterium nymphoidis]|uniref:ATP-binding cassette domain-containing protein n=1 Tax=Microbacterium nymphoidis TaxID=2898586 RepID=UPI001E511BB3|nr:ATP-binding cassette domain-containing protein [Microbacterium nymphoidis]MCD2498211.1 ATP-binding cassette domain-containing protein [Microbacterium nymphoidis]